MDALNYRKSISDELSSVQNRVRQIIDNRHMGEDGRYKEIILRKVIENQLQTDVSIGTGFVIGARGEISKQIDIIVYSNKYPVLFKLDDFVIVPSESVLGIIEVKTTIRNNKQFRTAVESATYNGRIIGKDIFNGIFGYACQQDCSKRLSNVIKTSLTSSEGFVNHICFNENLFCKYWLNGNPSINDSIPCYSFYEIDNLAMGYFISNLVEDVYIKINQRPLNQSLSNFLYPIESGKETRRINDYEIKILNNIDNN